MSASSLPRQLKAFNLYIDGDSYAGRVDTATLPALAFQMEDHRAGGMDAPVRLEMGMQAMQMSLVVSDYDPKLVSLLAKPETPFVLRGAVQRQGGAVESVVVNSRGMVSNLEFSEWSPGTKSTKTLTIDLSYFRYRQRDTQYCEIDIINMVRNFGGVDQLAEMRAAIGL